MVCFTGTEAVVLAGSIGSDSLRAFAHLAFCARAILRRDAADIIRPDWLACLTVPEPFNDSITEIAVSNFSTCNCACLRSSRSCWSAPDRFPIVPPQD
jgi:hypothetical protein